MPRPRLFPLFVIAAFVACSESAAPNEPNEPEAPRPDAALGRAAFEQECSGCHASRDGFDLRLFSFTDTTIIRRAMGHVDTSTALNIVAYINTVQAPRQPEETRLFQPAGAPLATDMEFALALFGRDGWPAELTSTQLAAIDPRTIRIALRLPMWSDEGSNLDWMPDEPLPPEILEFGGSAAVAAIAGYRAAPTAENLIRAVNALRTAERNPANPGAPCLLDDTLRVRYEQCFEVRRWTSTLVALHLLRNGTNLNLGPQAHNIWWDVGNAARRSRADRSVPIANPIENWATWMWLGWSFAPSQFASVYTGSGFRQLGLVRHATFIALRSQVARPPNSTAPYEDVVQAVNFSPVSWTTNVATFGLRHLFERLQAGERPTSAQGMSDAVARVNSVMMSAKIPAADRPAIQALGQQVLALLQ